MIFQNHGGDPSGALIADGSGNLYGTTLSHSSGGGGTFFELSPSGNTWTLQVLYNFSGSSNCGPSDSASDAAGTFTAPHPATVPLEEATYSS